MSAPLPIVGTETYVSYAVANALAADRLNGREWSAAVAEFEAGLDPESAGDPGISPLCRQPLLPAAAPLPRMPWASSLALPLPADAIPPELATACAELAFYLLTAESRRRRGV